MKNIALLIIVLCGLSSCNTNDINNEIVEASCGQCQFSMAGKGCDLAIRMNNNTYYVEGTNIDDYGDAHASDGFCEAIKKAKVSGAIVDGKFISTSFKIEE
ncbi:MAG: DUF6370 family protein [Flavobacteriaceae bacterium]